MKTGEKAPDAQSMTAANRAHVHTIGVFCAGCVCVVDAYTHGTYKHLSDMFQFSEIARLQHLEYASECFRY